MLPLRLSSSASNTNTVSLTVKQRPFGIELNTDHELPTISNIWSSSIASSLGLCIGDRLTELNGKPLHQINSIIAASLFREEALPFTATFESDSQPTVDVPQYEASPQNSVRSSFSLQSSASATLALDCYASLSPVQSATPLVTLVDEQTPPDEPYEQTPPDDAKVHDADGLDCCANTKEHEYDHGHGPQTPFHTRQNSSEMEFETQQNAYVFVVDELQPDLDGANNTEIIDELQLSPFSSWRQNSSKSNRPHISDYMTQPRSAIAPIRFDKMATTENADGDKVLLIQSVGLTHGQYEWSLEITSTGVALQEIGVVGTSEVACISLDDAGVCSTKELSARCVYGNELGTDQLSYSSYNDDGTRRCLRDLSEAHHGGWTKGDVIGVVLDLDKWRMRFLWNGQKVRHWLSLQPNKTYYPCVAFGDNCRYLLK